MLYCLLLKIKKKGILNCAKANATDGNSYLAALHAYACALLKWLCLHICLCPVYIDTDINYATVAVGKFILIFCSNKEL